MGFILDIEKYKDIEKEYWKFEQELLRKGIAFKETEKGIWGSVSCDEILEIFKKINLNKYKNFLDLGSGDGRVVLIASLFTKATGIEYDRELHEKAEEIKKKLGINAELINGDYMDYDLGKYDIIFINPDKNFKEIEGKLMKEFRGVLVVYNNIFLPRFLKKKRVLWVEQKPVYVYSVN